MITSTKDEANAKAQKTRKTTYIRKEKRRADYSPPPFQKMKGNAFPPSAVMHDPEFDPKWIERATVDITARVSEGNPQQQHSSVDS